MQNGTAQLSDDTVDSSAAMENFNFFGVMGDGSSGFGGAAFSGQPGNRGLLESSPHDPVHGAVGLSSSSDPGMRGLGWVPTAAFDPIFWVHHCMIDLYWDQWNCLPDRVVGDRPSSDWFDTPAWWFHNGAGQEVHVTRGEFFDSQALGVSYDLPSASCERPFDPRPLILMAGAETAPAGATPVPSQAEPVTLAQQDVGFEVQDRLIALPLSLEAPAPIALASPGTPTRVVVELEGIEYLDNATHDFDVFVVGPGQDGAEDLSRTSAQFVGSINVFGLHGHGEGDHLHHAGGATVTLDVTAAVADLAGDASEIQILIRPFALTQPVEGADAEQSPPGVLIGSGIRVLQR